MSIQKLLRRTFAVCILSAYCLPVGAQDVPDWAVGAWNGRNRKIRANLTLHISRRGNARLTYVYAGGRQEIQTGTVRGDTLSLGDNRYEISRASARDLKVVQANDPTNSVTYRRVRDRGDWDIVESESSPSWAVGRFKGFNNKYNEDIELTIERNGSAVAQIRHRDGKRETQTGSFKNDRLVLSGHEFVLTRNGNGLRSTQADDRDNRMDYQRY
jgi:hypothetical protein